MTSAILYAGQNVIVFARQHDRLAPFIVGRRKKALPHTLRPSQVARALVRPCLNRQVFGYWGAVPQEVKPQRTVREFLARVRPQKTAWNHPPLSPGPYAPMDSWLREPDVLYRSSLVEIKVSELIHRRFLRRLERDALSPGPFKFKGGWAGGRMCRLAALTTTTLTCNACSAPVMTFTHLSHGGSVRCRACRT